MQHTAGLANNISISWHALLQCAVTTYLQEHAAFVMHFAHAEVPVAASS